MIYVVRPGDTVYGISRQFGYPAAQIRQVNQLPTDRLVVGQALFLGNADPPPNYGWEVGGYVYPFVSPWVLRRTLPYLQRLSVFTYGFSAEGDLLAPMLPDQWIVTNARNAGVQPAMVLSPLGPDGQFNSFLVSAVLADPAAQDRLLTEAEALMTEKGYEELNIDFEFIPGTDREAFSAFVALAAERLPQTVSVCLAPKTSREQRGILFEGKDYAALGQAADRVLLMTYEWGYKYGPPLAVAPLDRVRQVVEYAVTEIEPAKIDLGLANYGYDWPLPFVRGNTIARTIGSVEAVEIARQVGAEISFDEQAQSPWFQYTRNGIVHEVWFEDIRSWQQKALLVKEFGLNGVGIWTLMQLFLAGLAQLGQDLGEPPQ